jgi:cupin superfamily acireductone dioxygenase involved in methionine salvage
MALVPFDVTAEEVLEAVRKFEEEERWQAENPEKHRLIRQMQVTVLFLEKMMGEIRGK